MSGKKTKDDLDEELNEMLFNEPDVVDFSEMRRDDMVVFKQMISMDTQTGGGEEYSEEINQALFGEEKEVIDFTALPQQDLLMLYQHVTNANSGMVMAYNIADHAGVGDGALVNFIREQEDLINGALGTLNKMLIDDDKQTDDN